jgi:hypothetical protein
MKTTRYLQVVLLLAALVAGSGASFAASTGELLQQGLYAEEVEGNPDAAFKLYTQIVQSDASPPNHIAQALYRMAVCCVKTNDEVTARKLVAKLIAEHANEREIVEKARALQDTLFDVDPAALMPPGTLAYIEFGSPGQQVETILGTLKGTPYENPLAAVGGAQTQNTNATQKSPGDIIGALFNPSMVTEFKKVHSFAVGITGVALQNPPMVAVLNPGKSDALRGLIQAALAMAGTQGEPIEGMQSVNIHLTEQEVLAVAYDERIIIAALPAEQLQWCVNQYKGLIKEGTLASANSSFAKLDKAQRRKSALTVWVKVGEAYGQLQKLFPPGEFQSDLVSANAIIDIANINTLRITDSIATNSVGTRIELQFEDGHRCLAFDLIRTPNLSKPALEAVPSQAIALASFSLNASAATQTETVRAQVRNITGLDIGREVFANVEQVMLYAMPAGGDAVGASVWESAASRLGVALTSREPEQTRQVLGTVLSAVAPGSPPPPDTGPNQFKVGKSGERDLYCFLDQAKGTTFLSLNRAVVDASVASLKNGQSVLTSGPLKGSLDKLPATASKLVLVNAGEALRLVGPHFKPEAANQEQAEQFHGDVAQLARALDKTVVEFRTDEGVDNLSLNLDLAGIPPLNRVIGPATEISGLLQQAHSEATTAHLRKEVPALIMPALQAPIIDGNVDEAWLRAPKYKLANELKSVSSGEKLVPIKSPDDLSADFRALWDEKNLYLLVDVTDDILVSDTDPNHPVKLPSGSTNIPWWWDDSVEIYLDADNAKPPQYGKHDAMFRFNWGPKPMMRVYNQNVETHVEGVEYAMVKTEKGYRLEASFPWNAFALKPSAGATVGLDVHVNDDDDGGPRDHKITWHDTSDQAYRSPKVFGNGLLCGLVGWWKFDETEGTTAKDSSGFSHDGKLVGNAKWSAGKSGGAIKLDGKNSYVRIADRAGFNMGNQVTVAGWVNIHSVPAEWMAIVTKGDNAWRLSLSERERRFHFSVNNWDRVGLNGDTVVPLDTWHHVAGVYDGEEVKLYVDGKLDAKQPWTEGIGRNNAHVLIGENAERKGRYFDGLLDDVRIYSYALGESEIKALAESRIAAQ